MALGDNARVVIVGGGPGGAACALALLRGSRARSQHLSVRLLSQERTGAQNAQHVGVLSPPLQQVLRERLGVELPEHLLQRRLSAYALHGEAQCLALPLPPYEREGTFAANRADFDAFLLQTAEAAGAEVIHSRARDVEVDRDGVTVSCSEGDMCGDVLVGAFGLEPTVANALHRTVGYVAPPHLQAVVATLKSAGERAMPVLLDDTVHAFLPKLNALEFGALIPNANDVSVVVAGQRVSDGALDAFLAIPRVGDLLGRYSLAPERFRARFPNGLARNAYADRFVTIGDAAGLVRPFKGKGIHAAVMTGIRAANTMLEAGISREAFARYDAECWDLQMDVRYGCLIRNIALFLAKRLAFDPVLTRARGDPRLWRALFLAVSGHGNSREIFWLAAQPGTAAGLVRVVLQESAGVPYVLHRGYAP
jgi:flavin-dependent dehydrogenase